MRSLLLLLVLTGCAPKLPKSTSPGASADVPPVAASPGPVDPGASAATAAGVTPTPAPAPLPVPQNAALRRKLDDAVAMLTTRDPNRAKAAIEALQGLTSEHPDVAAIPYNIGVARIIIGDEAEARRAWLRATEIDPTYGAAWLNLAALAARRGQLDMALANVDSGLRFAPKDLDLHVARIGLLRQAKRYDEAVQSAKTALRVNSKYLPVYTALAEVYLDTNQLDLSSFVLDKAIVSVDGAEGNARVQADRGEVYRRQGFTADALQSFQKAIELDPTQVSALGFLARYYLDNHDWSAAAPHLERLMSLQPDAAGPRISLGIAYRGLGRYDEARKLWEEALRLQPNDPTPLRNIAILYGDHLKDYATALATIDQYKAAGGGPPAEIEAWIAAVKKDQEKAEKKKKREEAERKRQEEEARKALEAPPPPLPTEGGAPSPDGGTPAPDGGTPAPGGGTPAPDGATPAPDGGTPAPDGGTPAPDGGAAPPAPEGTPAPPPAPTPEPPAPTPAPTPAPGEDNPWGTGGGGG